MNVIGIQVLDAVTRFHEIGIHEITMRKRDQRIARARQMLCYMLRKHAKMSYQRIGKALGLDHSTVIYHYQMVKYAADPNAILEREQMEEFYKMLSRSEYDEKIPF